ncbi:Uncharacterized protein Adt_39982 [Abeliophyllum distichum]|uniref:Uncharacterized protein n=1 Tax=Abeliophyllum distichum TaxID=126358 RepID=A0ABD1Q6L6_9LAMI
MSSSSCNSNSSSSSNYSHSLTKQLLEESLRDDGLCDKMSRNVVQTSAIHVPMIISTMMINRKRPHGGSMSSRCYIRRDRKERHELILDDYFKDENSKYTPEHFRRRFQDGHEIIQTYFTSHWRS